MTVTVPQLRSPIVLVHGLLGYDRIKIAGWTLKSYFPGIPELLTAAGNRVLIPALHPTCGVADRATQLKEFLDREVPAEPVHLIGHSMGGLDCRYLISKLGMAERVLTLTTIATPHHGSPFADWGIKHLERVVRPVLDLFAIPHQAFYDLTTDNCRQFNEEVVNAPGVRYFSVAGQYDGVWIDPTWQLSHRIILDAEGPNDGLVSLVSAKHGESFEVWEGDHLALVNWPNLIQQARGVWRDRSPEYGKLIARLKEEGF
jgi:triacylglycerol lipase